MTDGTSPTSPALPDDACPSCGQPLDTDRCAYCGYEAKDLRIGMTIDGKYRIETLVGRGGMGRIYGATHLVLGQSVAVKFLHGAWTKHSTVRARFRREAQALAIMRHPGVVSVLDFGEVGEELFMVMELVHGTSLAKRLHEEPPVSMPAIAAIFDQVLQVLETAHAAGIVHRDIKPDNVMLVDSPDREPRIKLLDFGIAFVPAGEAGPRLTETGTIQGTPHYMSPEQCRGRDVGPASDVYSVGVMLFEALAGAPPFDAEEAAGLMVQQMFVEPPHFAEVGRRANVPPGVERVVRRALAKKSEDRPTAREMRDLLSAAMRGTDPETLALRAAAERQRMASLSRSERAPTGVVLPRIALQEAPTPTPNADAAHVVLWMPRAQRSTVLRDHLAVNDLSATLWTDAAPPPAEVDGEPVRVIVVLAEPDGAPRTRAVRAQDELSHAQLLVIDALDATQTAAMIRAGASDVTLSTVGDEDVCRKVRRLLKRGR